MLSAGPALIGALIGASLILIAELLMNRRHPRKPVALPPEQARAWDQIMHDGSCVMCGKTPVTGARIWFRTLEPALWADACPDHQTTLILAA